MSWVGCRSFELMTFLRILSIYLFLLVRMVLGWPPLPRCSSGFDFPRPHPGHVLFCPALQMILKPHLKGKT